MGAFGMTFASTTSRLVSGVIGFRAQPAQNQPGCNDDQSNERQDLKPWCHGLCLFPGFPDRTASFGAVVRAIRLDRKAAPNGDDRADQHKGDGHDLENGFHERSNRSVAIFGDYIGTVLPWLSGSLLKRRWTMVSQISDIGLIQGRCVISPFAQQQEQPKCRPSSIACHLLMRFTADAGPLRGFWPGLRCRFLLSVFSLSPCVAMGSWKRRRNRRRFIPTSDLFQSFGACERGLPC